MQFRQIGPSVWRTSGCGDGKNVLILGGVHGNELTGVEVVKRLHQNCPTVVRGSLTVAIGNPEAVEKGSRGSVAHADLNRCFPIDLLHEEGNLDYESRRAKELAPLMKNSDLMIDLHSTNKPSDPFIRLAGNVEEKHFNICRWLPCSILLKDPLYKLAGKVALTDEYVGVHGGIGVCFESGIANDVSGVDEIEKAIYNILGKEMNLFEDNISDDKPVDQPDVYEIKEVFKLPQEGFEWSPGKGLKNFDFIPKGSEIGSFGNGEILRADEDSYIIFPKIKELWKVNSPLGWIAMKH